MNVLAMVLDLVGSILLGLYGLILGPLGVLRGPIAFERTFWYLCVLLPQQLLARSVRTAIDWRLGHFDSAIAQLEGLVGSTEDYYKDKPSSVARRRVLEDLYTVLARAYMHAGHIDDAMLVVIRAKKCMGIDRLGGLADLDAKTAHLVRAGLAAGRLLDGGGLATMFVKSNQTESDPSSKRRSRRQGATRRDSENGGLGEESGKHAPGRQTGEVDRDDFDLDAEVDHDDGAKIIPFPNAGEPQPPLN